MKKTGSAQNSAAEPLERVRLQADVAKQRVRIAKDELKRARKRLGFVRAEKPRLVGERDRRGNGRRPSAGARRAKMRTVSPCRRRKAPSPSAP